MKSINLIYKNGHFYNADSKKRILFKDGEEFCIVSKKTDFGEAPSAGRVPKKILSSEELLNLLKKKGITDFHKICKKNDILLFSIHTDKTYTFKVLLFEDLYLYRHEKGSDYKLFDCQVKTIENVEDYIDFFEPVYGKSLSDVRKCTYVHYFGNNGNPSANALTDFMLIDKKTTIDDLRVSYSK